MQICELLYTGGTIHDVGLCCVLSDHGAHVHQEFQAVHNPSVSSEHSVYVH